MKGLRESNTYISRLNDKQLNDFLMYVKHFNFKYLDKINLPDNMHFGIEIETENGSNDIITSQMTKNYNADYVCSVDKIKNKDYSKWRIYDDGSLQKGIELASPILNDDIETWKMLKDVCELLEENNAKATPRTGAHMHFNVSLLKNYKSFIRLFNLYMVYENILIKFGCGPSGLPRQNMYKYAKPISDKLFDAIKLINNSEDLRTLSFWIPYEKHLAMSVKNVNWFDLTNENKNTIEFRSPNGTTNYIIWQNLINAFGHFYATALNDKIDDFLRYKIKNYHKKNYQNFNKEIYLKEALELADIIFNNNYDKVMFIKQYFGNDGIDINNQIKIDSYVLHR